MSKPVKRYSTSIPEMPAVCVSASDYDALAQRCAELTEQITEQVEIGSDLLGKFDAVERERDALRTEAEQARRTADHWKAEHLAGNAVIDTLHAEVERLRMQLAACGVVAMSNTPESAAKAREMHPDYMSASCQDVMRSVDREMALRAEVERLRRIRNIAEQMMRTSMASGGGTYLVRVDFNELYQLLRQTDVSGEAKA